MSAVSRLSQFAALGKDTLIGMAGRGELDARFIWLAAKGATRYVGKVMAGQVASEDDATNAASACSSCPDRHERHTTQGGKAITIGYCGPKEEAGKTCGCLTFVTVNGLVRPAGKTLVSGETCTQEKWRT